MKIYHLHCRKNCVEASLKNKVVGRFKSYPEYLRWEGTLSEAGTLVMASSDMDFPREYTKSKRIIKLCDKIRTA